LQSHSCLDQREVLADVNARGKKKKRGERYRIAPTYSPLFLSLPQPLEEHEGSIEGDNLALSYKCDRLNTTTWLSSQPKGELLRF